MANSSFSLIVASPFNNFVLCLPEQTAIVNLNVTIANLHDVVEDLHKETSNNMTVNFEEVYYVRSPTASLALSVAKLHSINMSVDFSYQDCRHASF